VNTSREDSKDDNMTGGAPGESAEGIEKDAS
jgi:hypothetical protein